ncbi:hypothetical protein AB0N21_33470, partial [Streptomyces sp. NPDC051080]
TVINENTTNKHDITFTNNIVVKEGTGTATFNPKSNTVTLAHNTLVNVRSTPGNPGGSTADPRLTDPTGALPDGLRLRSGSPALRAGTPVPGSPRRDLYGNPVGNPPNMGAYQGRGVAGPLRPTATADAGNAS